MRGMRGVDLTEDAPDICGPVSGCLWGQGDLPGMRQGSRASGGEQGGEEGKAMNKNKSRIICLCGSTRFTELMLIKQWELTKQGFVVLSWCALPDSYFKGEPKSHVGDEEGVKKIVDEVHMRKIDLADEVFVLNVGGYMGESTRNEIMYAQKMGKSIKYLEQKGFEGGEDD